MDNKRKDDQATDKANTPSKLHSWFTDPLLIRSKAAQGSNSPSTSHGSEDPTKKTLSEEESIGSPGSLAVSTPTPTHGVDPAAESSKEKAKDIERTLSQDASIGSPGSLMQRKSTTSTEATDSTNETLISDRVCLAVCVLGGIAVIAATGIIVTVALKVFR